jgi:hypothetical protein
VERGRGKVRGGRGKRKGEEEGRKKGGKEARKK